MIRNVGPKIPNFIKDLKKIDLKEKKDGIEAIEKPEATEETKEPSLLDDPLFIKGYLESYRDELYYLNCSSDTQELIMNALESELRNYYKEKGETGLKEHLDTVFEKLKNAYLEETTNTTTTKP